MSVTEIISLNEAVRRRSREDPSRPFIREVGGRCLSYGECDAEATSWAGLLARLGVGAGDNVAVMAPPSASWVTAWMGINLLDARCVGINTLYLGRMLQYVINQCHAEVVVAAREYAERFDKLSGSLDRVRHLLVLEDCTPELSRERQLASAPLSAPDRTQVYGITYTSGTTGPSKGVLVTWTGLYNLWFNGLPMDRLGSEDVWYSPFPMNHFGGAGSVLYAAVKGGQVVLRETWSTSEFWNDVRRFGVTVTMLVGTMASFLIKQPSKPDDADHSLRYLSVTPVPADVEGFENRFGFRIWTLYAMTETSTVIYTELSPRVPGTCGRRREGFDLRIVDDAGNDCPPGQPGELWVRADDPLSLMQGYFDMPEATAAAWHDGWFRTGDMLSRDEQGYYYFVDRKKDALRRRGENISSREVEVEVNAHPAVLDSAAIGVPSEDAEDEVMVVVELQPGARLDPAELIAFLSERLPRFMVPRYLEVVDALPRTATGKVSKQQLRGTGVTERTWSAPARGRAAGQS